MTDKMLTTLKIFALILFLIAISLGGWLIYKKYFFKPSVNQPINEKTELTWWILYEDEEDVQILADAYEKLHPNTKILIEKQTDDNYLEKIVGHLSDSNPATGPDILRIHNTWITGLQQYLYPAPSSTIGKDEFENQFYPTVLSDLKGNDGNFYAIPMMFDGLGVYYNKTLLRKAGYTVPAENWDDFVEQAVSLTQYNNDGSIKIAGAALGSANNIDFAFEIVSTLMMQEGSTIVDRNGKTTFASDSDLRAAYALKFYTDFVIKNKTWSSSFTKRDVQMFTEGRLAMMFAPSWRVFDINKVLRKEGVKLDYDIAPFPQQKNVEGKSINWSDYWAEAVSKDSKHPQEAWDFLKFVTEKEQLRAFYEQCQQSREFGEIYSRSDMSNELISEKYVGAYIKMAPTAKTWKMVNKSKMKKIFNDLIEDIVSTGKNDVNSIQGKLIQSSESIEEITTSGI